MHSLFEFAIVIGIIAGLGVAVEHLISSVKRPSRPKIAANWQPPESDPLPYAKRKYFFSAAERSFYEVLRRAAPNHTVFAKVRLADVIRVTKGTGAWRSHLNRIDRKHLDFVICRADLAPAVAVELDDSSHDEEERAERDQFVDQALAAAALPIVHVRAKHGYKIDELREMLSPYIKTPAQSSSEVAKGEAPFSPPKGWRPAV